LHQSLRIVRIGLVDLHLERRPRMPRVKANDFEPASTQFVNQPRRHGTGLDPDTRIFFGVPAHNPLNLSGSDVHWPRHSLRPVSSTMQMAVSFCDTSKPR
jgi:hypothetical protein